MTKTWRCKGWVIRTAPVTLNVRISGVRVNFTPRPTENWLTFYSLLVTWSTKRFNIQELIYCSHCIYVFVFIWEQTATCATFSINWLVFITEMKSVYCAVRTGSFNKAVCASFLMVKQCAVWVPVPDRYLGEEKNILFLTGFELQTAQPVVLQCIEYGNQIPF